MFLLFFGLMFRGTNQKAFLWNKVEKDAIELKQQNPNDNNRRKYYMWLCVSFKKLLRELSSTTTWMTLKRNGL